MAPYFIALLYADVPVCNIFSICDTIRVSSAFVNCTMYCKTVLFQRQKSIGEIFTSHQQKHN